MASSDSAQQGSGWDEAQCKEALAQLERVQEHLDNLRLTINRIVHPLRAPLANNSALYIAYKQAVVGSSNNLKYFYNEWNSREIQSILEHTRQSLNANTDLSANAQVPRYGWQQSVAAEKKAAGRRRDGAQTSEASQTHLSKEEIAKTVEGFQRAYPQIRVGSKDGNQDLMIQFVADSLRLRFHVLIDQEANGSQNKLRAECLGTTKPFTTITRCISIRPRANDLAYLLDMIAAYKTVNASTCAKCTRLLDNSAQIPTARRSKQLSKEEGTAEIVWEAFHEGCLE